MYRPTAAAATSALLSLALAATAQTLNWQPYPDRAAMMVMAAHQDDEGLWGGGLFPYYATVRDLPVIWVVTATTPGESRIPEADTAAWVYGLRYKPVQLFETTAYDRNTNCDTLALDSNWLATLVGLVRRFRPDVIVTHSHIGEYTWGDNCTGHPQHLLTNMAVMSAFDMSADSTKFPGQLDTVGVWQVKKVYEYQPGYLWGRVDSTYLMHDWDTHYPALGGKTPFEVAVEALKTYYTGTETYDKWGYHCWQFPLVRSTVGPDVVRLNDMFENAYAGVLDSTRLSFTSSGPLSKTLTLTLRSAAEPFAAFTAQNSAAWLSVSVVADGNNRRLVNTVSPSGLQAGVYADTVALTGPGLWGMKYTVTLRVEGTPSLASIRISPPRPSVYPGDTVAFTATGYDQYGARLAVQPSFQWTGTIGPADSRFAAERVSDTPFVVTASSGAVRCTTKASVFTFRTIHVAIDTARYRGSLSVANGTFRVTGTPDADVWASDQFFFAYVPIQGDFDAAVRFDTALNMATYSKTGFMFRDELQAWGRFNDLYRDRSGGYGLLMNQTAGEGLDPLFGTMSSRRWARFKRTGAVVSTYISSDGESWTWLASREMTMSGTDYLGLFCAGNSATPTGVFSNLRGFFSDGPAATTARPSVRPVSERRHEPYLVQIYRLDGRLVKRALAGRALRLNTVVSRAGLPPGTYCVVVRNRRGEVIGERAVVQVRGR